jgi:probable glucitol transport protein GutA
MYAFAGANIPMLLLAAVLTSIGALPASFLATVLIIDNATYNEWKGNRRLESVGGGVQSFAQSAGSGLAAGLAGLVLGFVGYNGAHNTQSATAISGIVLLMSWVPAGLSVVVGVIALFYNRFERRLPELTEQIEFRKTGGIPVGSLLLDPTQVNANPTSALLASGEELVGTVEGKLRKRSRNRGERG